MAEKIFKTKGKYLHFPVIAKGKNGYVIKIFTDGAFYGEFYIPVAPPGEAFDFYSAIDFSGFDEVKLVADCDEGVFEGIIIGNAPENEKELYPDLYNEKIRQRIHYSPRCGWINDPNGLFYKDGVFNLYYQHNPVGNRHDGVNISWGHAISRDGIHFTEHREAIVPEDVNYIVASGSAIVDEYDISGFGKGTIIAAYTKLIGARCLSLHPEIIDGEGQIVVYSTDGGVTFNRIGTAVTIPAPPKTYWRDPKLIQIDEKTLCMAVYETFEGKNCVSFYKSTDAKKWEFCSRNMDLYECPDLFRLIVEETGEEVWVLYGGNGKYRVGNFENFVFEALPGEGFLDYGDSVYAGQTYNNYPDNKKRLFTAWLREDFRREVFDESVGKIRHFGFSQSMNIMSELSLHKVGEEYRVMRKPVKELDLLRKESEEIIFDSPVKPSCPGEIELTMDKEKDFKILADKELLCYNALTKIVSFGDKLYKIACQTDFNIRIVCDTNSVEIFLADEIVLSYFCDVKSNNISIQCDKKMHGRMYCYSSVWKG